MPVRRRQNLCGNRLQHVDASLRIRVANVDKLSQATSDATRVARSLGGYALSVKYRTPTGKPGRFGLISPPAREAPSTAVTSVFSIHRASHVLPPSALPALRAHRIAEGTVSAQGHPYLFAARSSHGDVVVVSRPDVVEEIHRDCNGRGAARAREV